MVAKEKTVASCGLYCAECPVHAGKIADLARDLRKELRSARFDKTAAALSELSFFGAFEDYERCYEVLGAMVKMRCRQVCRDGGGNPFCKIRKCCERKKLDGCWACSEYETCAKLDDLRANHGVAHIKNLRRIKKKGIEGFLEGKKEWYVKP